MLPSPRGCIIGARSLGDAEAFYGALGFEVVSRGTVDRDEARALYGVKATLDEMVLGVRRSLRQGVRAWRLRHRPRRRSIPARERMKPLRSLHALLCDAQGLDARHVSLHGLCRVPEIDRPLGVQPELRRVAEQAGEA